MGFNLKELQEQLYIDLDGIDTILERDVPDIDLYVDQVTTLINGRLKALMRDPSIDKGLTKSMINNYTKAGLIHTPIKKKYSREHILMLNLIYHLKSELSINDIEALIKTYQSDDERIEFNKLYQLLFDELSDRINYIKEDMGRTVEEAEKLISDEEGSDSDKIITFIFITIYEMHIKKIMIEKLIDRYIDSKKSNTKCGVKAKSDSGYSGLD